MVNHVVESLMASQAQSLVVVTGHDYAAVEAALPPSSGKGRGFTVTHNPDYTSGLASSLRRGLAALPDNIDGVLVCLRDMPRPSPAIVDRLLPAFNPLEGHAIRVPPCQAKHGNLGLFARRLSAGLPGGPSQPGRA